MKLDDAMSALAAGAPAAAGSPGAPMPDAQAWRREMERAQADTWFHRFVGDQASHSPTRTAASVDKKDNGNPQPEVREAAYASGASRTGAPTAAPYRAPLQPLGSAPVPLVMTGPGLPAAYQTAAAPTNAVAPARPTALTLWTLPSASAADAALIEVTAASHAPMQADGGAAEVAVTPADPSLPADAPATWAAATPAKARTARQESTRLPVRVHVEGNHRHATVWLGLDAQAAVDLPAVTRAISQWLAQAGYGKPAWICNGQALDPSELAPMDASQSERPSRKAATPFPFIDPAQGEPA
jgi:hypothetical protein